jgi:hypothetical protein
LPKKTGSAEPGCKGKHSFGSGKRFEKKFFPFFLAASPPLLLLPMPTNRLKNPRKAGAKITHHSTLFQIFLRVFLKKIEQCLIIKQIDYKKT